MKRIIYLSAAFLCVFQAVSAQKQFSDGEVTYSVKVDLPADAAPRSGAAFRDTRLVYSFKNYLFRSDMYLGRITYTNIRNARDNSGVTLIDAGTAKYLIRMNREDLSKESARYAGVHFTQETGSREIAGYNCKQATGKLEDGTAFTVYYTPDLVPGNGDYEARFKGLQGLPLEFETTTSRGVKMTMTATHVSIAPQPSARFDIPTSGYREITYDELEQLRKK